MTQGPVGGLEEPGFYSQWHEKPLEGFEQGGELVLPDLKEAGSSVCMFRTKVKRRDQGGGYGDGPGRKVAGRVWDLKWMDSEI